MSSVQAERDQALLEISVLKALVASKGFYFDGSSLCTSKSAKGQKGQKGSKAPANRNSEYNSGTNDRSSPRSESDDPIPSRNRGPEAVDNLSAFTPPGFVDSRPRSGRQSHAEDGLQPEFPDEHIEPPEQLIEPVAASRRLSTTPARGFNVLPISDTTRPPRPPAPTSRYELP